jgi:hypothetical protein
MKLVISALDPRRLAVLERQVDASRIYILPRATELHRDRLCYRQPNYW